MKHEQDLNSGFQVHFVLTAAVAVFYLLALVVALAII
jgi:hypothetical protein